jgi:hypothetical protein
VEREESAGRNNELFSISARGCWACGSFHSRDSSRMLLPVAVVPRPPASQGRTEPESAQHPLIWSG